MTINPADMDRAIAKHFEYEANDDVEGVLSTLAPGARHDIVGRPGGPTRGREGTRPVYEALYADLTGTGVDPIRRFYGEDFLVDESLWRGKAAGQPFGLDGRGREIEFRILHVVEFDDDLKMRSEQVWVDLAAVQQQLPQD